MYIIPWVLFGIINTLLFLYEEPGVSEGKKLHAFLLGITTALSGGVVASVFLQGNEGSTALFLVLILEAMLLIGLVVRKSFIRTA